MGQSEFGSKNIMLHKLVVQKNFGSKKSKKKLYPKKLFVQKNLDPNNFGSKNLLGSKYFRSKKSLDPTKFWVKKMWI